MCGFMVIDEDSRTIVIEGLGGSNGGLTMLLQKVGRTGPNGQAYRALESTRQRFSQRLYTCFNIDLKKVLVTFIFIIRPHGYLERCNKAITLRHALP